MPTRSHQGCWTCKRKRRRCDNAQPQCNNCARLGIECEGYEVRLRWGSGIASRGRFTGAEKPIQDSVLSRPKGRKRDLAKGKKAAIRLNDNHSPFDDVPPARSTDMPNVADVGIPAGFEDIFLEGARSKQDEVIFCEFLNSGMSVLHSTTAGETLLQPRLPQLCRESSALFTICLAFQLSLKTTQSQQFFEYFDKALREFRSELAQRTTLPDGTLLSGLLLSSIGLMHGLPWTIHLEGMHNILQSHEFADQQTMAQSNSFRAHLFEVMGVMDLPYFSVGRQTPVIGIWKRYCQSSVQEDGPEPMSGIPRSLINLYSGIGSSTTEQCFWDWPGEVGSFLQCYLWEAHRLAGILVIRRVNGKARRDSQKGSTGSNWRQPNECPASETILVGRILANLDALRLACIERPSEDAFIKNAILFPIFNAGLEAAVLSRNPEWKNTIQRCLLGSPQDAILLSLLTEMWQADDPESCVDDVARSRQVEMGLL